MTTYSIKAPNGQTYRIDGPEGATDDQVRAEVMRQHGTTVSAPPPVEKPATALSTAGRMAWNLPGDAMNALKSAAALPGEALNAVMHPVKTANAVGSIASDAANILQGGIQHVREMSPADLQGSAPKMSTAEFDKFAADNYGKYGTKQNVYKTVGDHPLVPVMAIASLLNPALKIPAIAEKIAAAGEAVKGVTAPLKAITHAERRATAGAAQMRAEANAGLSAGQAAADTEVGAAERTSARAASLAERLRARGGTLNERRAAAMAEAAPPELAIGDPRHLSEMGDSVREPALASQDAINTKMRAADAQYRGAMEQVAADRKASGVGVSDGAVAKDLIRKSKDIVEPDPVARPSVGSVPADSAGGKLHNMLLDVLQPKEVPLTVNEAKRATEAGIKVNKAPDGSFTRTIKPDLKNVDDFRRFLGKVLDGKIEGYEAVNRAEAGSLYDGVSKVIDEYVSGASRPVQQNWAAGKIALQPFEKVRAGKALVGTQGATNVANVPAATIPGRMIAGGRDTMRQTAAVAGEAPVAATLRSHVQNAFLGAKDADAAAALVRPGTTLGDAVNADKGLSASVTSYIQKMRAAEAASTRAESLGRRASTSMDRASRLDKTATAAQGKATAASSSSGEYARSLATLEIAAPKQVGAQYTSMLERAHKSGQISTERYSMGLKLAARAEKDFAIKATRDMWLRRAGYAIGLGAAPVLGADVVRALEK